MQHIINNFLQKKSQIKPKYFTEFTTKHINCLHLSSLSQYPVSQLDVFGHDGDSLSVDGTQISIFKQTLQVRFASLLQCLRWRHSGTSSRFWNPGRSPSPTSGKAVSGSEARWISGNDGFLEAQQSRACSDEVFFTPPVEGALFLAALVASCLRAAFPPVDLRAVCLVWAIFFCLTPKF